MISPASHALRYRIWAYANPRGWDCTNAEIADALGVGVMSVRATVAAAGWSQRLRVTQKDDFRGGHFAANAGLSMDSIAGRIGIGE